MSISQHKPFNDRRTSASEGVASENYENQRESNLGRASLVGRVISGFKNKTGGFLGALITLFILVVILSITESTFLTTGNVKNVMVTNSSLFIVAAGMTFVMISAGFDLSVGAVMAVSEELLYEFIKAGIPSIGSILLVLLIGFAIGAFINGFLIGVLGINFFVVTLGTMTFLYGAVDVASNGASNTIQSHFLALLGTGSVVGIPAPVVLVVLVLTAGIFILRFTSAGRAIYGTGGNREAARLAGIPVRRVMMMVYGISGLCGALAGVFEAGRLSSADPTAGTSIALIAGAAVLLGGTSLFGGVGGLSGTIAGVLVIAVLGNGVNLLGVSNYWQDVVTGLVLIGAVILDGIHKKNRVFH